MITTIPREGPTRVGRRVQFSCEVEPTESGPMTYQWRTVEYAYGGSTYSSESFNRTYDEYHLRYCWYFCTVTLRETILGSANKLVEVHGKSNNCKETCMSKGERKLCCMVKICCMVGFTKKNADTKQ